MTNYILIIFCLEVLIYAWSACTATLKKGNYFAISSQLIFEKCARNSGRVSAILNLTIILMLGYFGLKQIYSDKANHDIFLNLVTLLTINHLIHFFYISQNFKRKSLKIKLAQEKRGIFTYICITLFPIFIWYFKNLNALLYICIMLHLLNVSYVFILALKTKIKYKSKITIHNRFGIIITIAAWILVVYRVFVEI
jgi:hypothetical protein